MNLCFFSLDKSQPVNAESGDDNKESIRYSYECCNIKVSTTSRKSEKCILPRILKEKIRKFD